MLAAPPQLIEKPQDVQKLIDDSLAWECKATGKPKPSYRWMKNGENLEPSEVSSDQQERNFRIKDKFASSMNSSSPATNTSCGVCATAWRMSAGVSAVFGAFPLLIAQTELPFITVLFIKTQHPHMSEIPLYIHFDSIRHCLISFSLAGDEPLNRISILADFSDPRASLIFC